MAQPTKSLTNPANGNKTSDPTLQDLYAMMDIMKADMQQLSETISEVGKAEARRAVDSAKDKGRDLKKAGHDQYEALRHQAEDYGNQAGAYVRDNPLNAVGIAAGLGFVVGFLLSSRR